MGGGQSRAPARGRSAPPQPAKPSQSIGDVFNMSLWTNVWRDIIDPRPSAVVNDQGLTVSGTSINGGQGGAQENRLMKLLINPRQTTSSAQMMRVVEEGSFSANTKLFVRPSIPFQFKFQNREISASSFALYHPCPIRIENVQYDAVLAFNDPANSQGTCIMIPLRSRMQSERGEFVRRIAQHIPTMLVPRQETQNGKTVVVYDPGNVPVGTGWDPSRMFTTGPNSAGETEILDAYFSWNAGVWEQYVESDNNALIRHTKWRQVNGRTYIMLKEPVDIGPAEMSFIISLPTTEASRAIEPFGAFSYQPGRAKDVNCRATANDIPPGKALEAQETRRKEAAAQVMYVANSVFLLVGLVLLIWGGIKLAKWVGPSVQAGAGWMAKQFSKRIEDVSKIPPPAPAQAPPQAQAPAVAVEEIVPEIVNPMRTASIAPTTPLPSPKVDSVDKQVLQSLQGFKSNRVRSQSPKNRTRTRTIVPSPIPSPDVSRPITAEEVVDAAGTGLPPISATPPEPVSATPPEPVSARPTPIDTRRKRRNVVPTPPSSPTASDVEKPL